MAYIDYVYYTDTFGGTKIKETEFKRLAEMASDIIDGVAIREFVFDDLPDEAQALVKKAVAYEVETLDSQGGVDAIVGLSAQSINSEALGDYHVSGGSTAQNAVNVGQIPSMDGIPISPLVVTLLRKAGLMNRWAYAGFYENCKPPDAAFLDF